MRKRNCGLMILGALSISACAILPASAQTQDPQQQQYPPSQQYPQQPPPRAEYPPSQGQYPPPQNQQGQYPPQQVPGSQGQSPAGQYPQAQSQYGQPPLMPPQQLDQLVGPIALYPDGLLAQVLTASTFFNEIPEAAAWANQHGNLHGDILARAIQEDNLPWDASVMALLPFPNVLNYMAQYMAWTQQLGNAVLAQRGDVMDAVQRMRQRAYDYGYLRSSQYDVVSLQGPGQIEILPVSPGYYYVPYYDPYLVYARPRPGFYLGGAIRFGAGITIGAAFAPWGWGGVGFGWREHNILIDRQPWGRTWGNRQAYVHPYAQPYRHVQGPRVERHEVRGPERERR